MRVRQTLQNREYIERLWEDFLLAGIGNELLLGEIGDHLYIESVPEALLARGADRTGIDPAVRYVAETGFADVVEGAVAQMEEDPRQTRPYSALLRSMTADELAGRLWERMLPHIRRFPKEAVTGNPYFQHVHPRPGKAGPFRLGQSDYLPFECWQAYHTYDPADPFFHAEAGFFDQQVQFPVLFEENRVWMSIVMSEIDSMRDGIREARGRVITYGLGLGYYAYMAAEKPEVESVTAVELDPRVIRLFREHILPQFPHPEKIHIIEGDAFAFLQTQEDGAYDYGYADFWAGTEDGFLLYLQFLPLAERFQKTRFGYWIESCFQDYYLRPAVMKWLMEEGAGRRGHIPENDRPIQDRQDRFIAFLNREEGTISAPDEMARVLSPEGLSELTRRFVRARGQ